MITKNTVYTVCALLLMLTIWLYVKNTMNQMSSSKNIEKVAVQKKETSLERVNISIREIIESKQEQPKVKKEHPLRIKKTTKPSYYKYSNELAVKGLESFDKTGDFPVYYADYKRFLGFNTYRKMMERLGGNFFIADAFTNELLYRINFETNELKPTGELELYSPLSRSIRNEAYLGNFLSIAERNDNTKNYIAVLLLPRRIDAFIREVLRREIERSGSSINDYSSFSGIYKSQRGLTLNVNQATDKKGNKSNLNIIITL